jgi:DNA polymerase-3 subunit alpha
VLPPDINSSYNKFTVSENKIRFGLSAVKNVGNGFINAIIAARNKDKFQSFTDFIERIERIDSSVMNKRAVESLIKCGAMDSLGANRAQLLSIFEKTIDGIHSDRKRNIEGQFSIFDTIESKNNNDNLPNINEFPQKILLSMEKEMLGIYVSGHPLQPYIKELKDKSTIMTSELSDNMMLDSNNIRDGQRVTIGGIITEKKNKITKNNNMMAFITLEDLYGSVECIVFPATYDKYNRYIEEDMPVVVEGRLSTSEVEDTKIICEKISSLNAYKRQKIYIKISKTSRSDLFSDIKTILKKYPGSIPVYIYLEKENKSFIAGRDLWIKLDNNNAIAELQKLLGEKNVKVS